MVCCGSKWRKWMRSKCLCWKCHSAWILMVGGRSSEDMLYRLRRIQYRLRLTGLPPCLGVESEFSAKCGDQAVEVEGLRSLPEWSCEEQPKGSICTLLRSIDIMCVVKGRKGRDAFTCVVNKEISVVEYCMVKNLDYHTTLWCTRMYICTTWWGE